MSNLHEVARARRVHASLVQRRSVLVSELAEAERRLDRMKAQAARDPALCGVEQQRAQLERIGALQKQLAEHDKAAVTKLKQRTTGAANHE